MQNLPFLVSQNLTTQNTPQKSAVTTLDTQKLTDSGSSFQQVLSKKVESKGSKKDESQSIKTQQSKSQQHHTQSHSASKIARAQATNEKKEIAEIEGNNFDTAALPADSVDLIAVLSVDRQAIDTGEIEVTTALQEAVAVAGVPLPVIGIAVASLPVNTEAAQTQDGSLGLDLQKRLQLEASLKTALDQTTKAAAKEEKHTNSVEESASDKLLLKDELSEKNNKWLESVLPSMSKPADGGESLPSKLMSKLMSEAHAQSLQESSTKFKKESGLTGLIVANSVLSATTQMDVAQMQAASSNVINAYPGKTGWDQAISQKVVWMVGAKEQTATLTLNPPDLGPLQVVINVNNDKADTTFISENPEVRKALQDGISTLRGLMDQAGVQLGQANVSTGKQQQDFQQAAKERSLQHTRENASAEPVEAPAVMRNISRANNGLVDIFA